MLKLDCHETREDWLKHRDNHIGASEAAVVCGLSKWMSPIELWKLKTGRLVAKDLSGNPNVAYGTRAEDALRQLFIAKHPELELTYRPFDFLYQEERKWLQATLDGKLKTKDGSSGILEIKTCSCNSRSDWKEWDGKIPDHYFCQIAHQFLATGFDFAYLFAELMNLKGESTLKTYYFLREDLLEDMDWLLGKEEKFWNEYVLKNKQPPVILTI